MKPRFVFTRPSDLRDATETQLDQLLGLTNSPDRGDVHDDGGFAGSSFEASIYIERERRKRPEQFQHLGQMIFIAAHVVGAGPRWLGWCLIEDVQGYYRRLGLGDAQFAVGFYVDPLQRRTGLAQALARRAIVAARAAGARALVARPWNSRSLAFFRKIGFNLSSDGGRAQLAL